MGWTAAQRNASPRGAELREQAARAARERRVRKRAARAAADPTLKFKATKAEHADRINDIQSLVESMEHPVTLRQIFYRAVVNGIVEKTDGGYGTIGRVMTTLREDETIPWEWVVDNTRRTIIWRMYANAAEAVRDSAESFMLNPWRDADVSVSIWMEKDALAGTLETITLPLGVPLHVMRGFGSLSLIKKEADGYNAADRPAYVYHLGDFDPSGQRSPEALERRLREFCTVPLHFKSLALSPEQIEQWDLPSRETKVNDNNLEWFVRKFGTDKRIKKLDRDLVGLMPDAKKKYLLELSPDSVELDAIEPNQLREIVRGAIMQHTSAKRIKANEKAEELIRVRLSMMRMISRAKDNSAVRPSFSAADEG